MKASSTEWVKLEGKLHLDAHPQKAVFYLEGPPDGVDLLVSTAVIKHATPPEGQGSPLKKQASTLDNCFQVLSIVTPQPELSFMNQALQLSVDCFKNVVLQVFFQSVRIDFPLVSRCAS